MEFAVLYQILSGYKLLQFCCSHYVSSFIWHSSTDLALHEICPSFPLFPQFISWNDIQDNSYKSYIHMIIHIQNTWREGERLLGAGHVTNMETPFRVWNWLCSTKRVLEGALTSMPCPMLENTCSLYRLFEALLRLWQCSLRNVVGQQEGSACFPLFLFILCSSLTWEWVMVIGHRTNVRHHTVMQNIYKHETEPEYRVVKSAKHTL